MQNLVSSLEDTDQYRQMQLGLAHSMSRYKLSFSSDKVDTMIIQAVSLLEDLDKELNNYAMRLKEWYSWHFPELAKIVTDSMTYAQAVLLFGMRQNVKNVPDEKLNDVL
jgi:nucleolar protein 58